MLKQIVYQMVFWSKTCVFNWKVRVITFIYVMLDIKQVLFVHLVTDFH